MAKSRPVDKEGHPIEYDPDFSGPTKHRSCTDILCFLVFLTFIGAWIGIGIYAYTSGDPNTLLVPKDSAGGKCGLDSHVKDKPYLFFFDLTKCLAPTVPFTGCPTLQVCVEKCPDYYYYWGKTTPNDISKLICNYDKIASGAEVDSGQCAKWYLPSYPFKNRCVPAINRTIFGQIQAEFGGVDNVIKAINNIKVLSQAEQIGQNIVDDLISSWWQILVGIGIAVLTCIVYIVIMRWLAAVMVWLSLIGVLVILSLGVYFTTKKYIEFRDKEVDFDDNGNLLMKKDTWLVLLIIFSLLLFIILLMIIFLRKRILLAISLVKEGSKAVSSVTSVLFFPIFPWIAQLGVIAFAISVALYLSTTGNALYKVRNLGNCICQDSASGIPYSNDRICVPDHFQRDCASCINANTDPVPTCKFITIENPVAYPYLQAVNVFGFLWGAFFMSALGQMILASVFAKWYWTRPRSNLPFFALTAAIAQTLRYHIGTLAFGSLIITICRVIRIALEYVDQKLKKYDNGFTKAILCCCKCFFWCLESFLKFINRNAYIMCAIHGKNFCLSAKDAFFLLMRNILRVWVLDKVTDFLFFLGKVFITVGVGALAYLIFATDETGVDNSGLNYQEVPVIVIMICTYFIATVFFNVYSMAVDTLFLCFLEDCERNNGTPEKPYFMSRNLMKIFGKKNKFD